MTAPTHCTECGAALAPNKRRLGTRCKPCTARAIGSDQAKREKCRAAMLRHFDDPNYQALHRRRTGDGIRRALENPDHMAALRERGRRCGLLHLGASQNGPGTAPRMAAGRQRHETVMAWCPIEYRGEYRRLTRSKLIPAPEARRMIEDMIAADLARALATGVLPQAARLASGGKSA